ncbi:hypothetical protein L1787_15610 [Acuticoccus sp. M5D2P5]|uniref:flavodoxin family protein n=1 Tax=Acuticoccus kalidii TaxID=2910977 RepID=UPI001F1FA45A|nr:hypothetical protein [Acuticoccus kalidii]MCF3934830.1 hypothetical protein [Acuticoccus kalidii]
MTKVLVVYYSETGHTAHAARYVAHRLGGVLERIVPLSRERRSKFSKVIDALMRRVGAVHKPAKKPADFPILVIATPVWAGALPPPVRGYLTEVSGTVGDVGFIVTGASAGSGGVMRALRHAVGHAPIAEVTITDADRRNGTEAAKLVSFTDALSVERAAA